MNPNTKSEQFIVEFEALLKKYNAEFSMESFDYDGWTSDNRPTVHFHYDGSGIIYTDLVLTYMSP